MIAPVVKATFRPMTGVELYPMIREACRVARSGAPGPVFVEVPANLYMFTHDVGELTWAPQDQEAPPLSAGLMARAVELLSNAQMPLLYVGAGATGATAEVLALAERLEAPVATTFQGKGVFPEHHPLFLWPGFGLAAPRFVRDIVEGCDLTLAIGCRFGEVGTGSYGLTPPGSLIHVDIDPDALGRNYPADVAIAADAGAFLRAVLETLGDEPRGQDQELRGAIIRGHTAVWDEWLKDVGGERVTPAHLLRTAQRIFGPDTVYTTDSGNGTFLALECLRLESHGKYLAPIDYSCMGYAIPAALGAKLAQPDAPVVALAGDGAFMMTGLEMATAAAEGIGVVALVLRDRELAQIAQFQSTAMNRKVASGVREYDLKHLAAGMGVDFLEMPTDESVEDVLVEADRLARDGRPVLVDVAIDYSRRTFFTKGVVKANLGRLPLKDQVRFVGRAVMRKITG
jgi:acetolactate synthase-1/2/3 large subunit